MHAPPFEVFDIVLGSTTRSVIALSNSTMNVFDFDMLRKQLCFNITGPPITTGYCYVTIPKELLWCDNPEQWQVWVNNTLIEDRKVMEVANYTYVYFTHNHSIQEVRIVGTHAASPPVGGKATPINMPMNNLETPSFWIWLTTIILPLAVTVVYVKKRKRNTEIDS